MPWLSFDWALDRALDRLYLGLCLAYKDFPGSLSPKITIRMPCKEFP